LIVVASSPKLSFSLRDLGDFRISAVNSGLESTHRRRRERKGVAENSELGHQSAKRS